MVQVLEALADAIYDSKVRALPGVLALFQQHGKIAVAAILHDQAELIWTILPCVLNIQQESTCCLEINV